MLTVVNFNAAPDHALNSPASFQLSIPGSQASQSRKAETVDIAADTTYLADIHRLTLTDPILCPISNLAVSTSRHVYRVDGKRSKAQEEGSKWTWIRARGRVAKLLLAQGLRWRYSKSMSSQTCDNMKSKWTLPWTGARGWERICGKGAATRIATTDLRKERTSLQLQCNRFRWSRLQSLRILRHNRYVSHQWPWLRPLQAPIRWL